MAAFFFDLYLQRDVVLLHHLPKVDDRISKAPQGRVDAHPGFLGNFFETEFLIHPQLNQFALIGGQVLNHSAQITFHLPAYEPILNVFLQHVDAIENVPIVISAVAWDSGGIAKMIHHQIVGNAHHPGDKLAFLSVLVQLNGADDLEKRLLKHIVGYIFVFYFAEDVVENLALMAAQKLRKTGFVSARIKQDKFLIG